MKKTVISLVFALLMLPAVSGAASLSLFFSPLPVLDNSSYLQQVGTLASVKAPGGAVSIFSGTTQRTASGPSSFISTTPDFGALRPGSGAMATHVMPTGGQSMAGTGSSDRVLVSEPSLLLLIGLGLVALGVARRR